jgi:hypothetical protein
MNFLYEKNYEKYLDDGRRGAVPSSSAHNMLWSAVGASPPSSVISVAVVFSRDRRILCSFSA